MAQQSLLFKIVRATHANGTHHKLALDALTHLRSADADTWRRVFMSEAEAYMEGAKAPDKEFKDFTNHVLHVRDGYWGGAAEKAMAWYAHTVEALQSRDWKSAAYAAGVMSHYYTDPIMPFHTAQSEAENNIHRAAEWSISKSYDDLNRLGKREFPLPDVPIEDREDWLADLVCDAAEISNTFYEKLIANYDLDRGVVDPVTGLNERARRIVAQLIAYAQVGQARILDRAIAEAGVQAPEVSLTVNTVLATLKIPVKWVVRKLADAEDRACVIAMYDELQATGTVDRTLPEDDRAVRKAFRLEVGEKSAVPRPEYRPPHVGGAFDYASALSKRGVAEDAENAEQTKTGLAGVTTARTSEAKVVAATAQDQPQKAEKSKEDNADRQEAAREADLSSLDTVQEPEKVVTGKQSGKVANRKPEFRKPVAMERDTATETTSASREPEAETDDEVFDAAAMLRERAAEMGAADATAKDKVKATDKAPAFRLHRDDEVEDGPSVGPKTAIRLNKIGIVTVQDLLDADPAATAEAVDVSYIRKNTVIDWQDQARMQCDVPGLSGTASQLIVGAGVRNAGDLANSKAEQLAADVKAFAESSEGNRLLRDRAAPDKTQVAQWIANAVFAAPGKAA